MACPLHHVNCFTSAPGGSAWPVQSSPRKKKKATCMCKGRLWTRSQQKKSPSPWPSRIFQWTGEPSYVGSTKPACTFGDVTRGPNTASGESPWNICKNRTDAADLVQSRMSYWECVHWYNWALHQTPCRSGKILRRFLFLGIRVLFGTLRGAYLQSFWAIKLQKSSPKHTH